MPDTGVQAPPQVQLVFDCCMSAPIHEYFCLLPVWDPCHMGYLDNDSHSAARSGSDIAQHTGMPGAQGCS